jgi:hypothetical protein
MQDCDERAQGAHLSQEKEMEVPQVWQGQDAGAEVTLEFSAPGGFVDMLGCTVG